MSDSRPELDLLDGDFYVSGTYERYAWFREHEPVAWDSANELWGIFRYDDLAEIEMRDDVFVNSDQVKGGYRPNIPADPAIIGLDNPKHTQRRKLVSRKFTPRAVAERDVHVREIVTELLDAALEKRRVDIVGELASVLPAKMIAWLLGFPDDTWAQLRDWSERTIVMGGGPRYFNEDGFQAAQDFFAAAAALYEEKKRCPADDVMTTWTTAEIDGVPVTQGDVASDCLLLLDGGAETTRTVIARTILALIDNPDQWDLLKAGADLDVATEEFIRYVSPIHNMCRVAREDYELGGVTIKAGQQVVLLYSSANRDESHFPNAEALDVRRTPNNHIAFGVGTHFCLGAGLARLEIKLFFEEFVRRVASMSRAPGHEVVEMPNAFVFGLTEATVDLVPA
ncbi:MAG: cytochrome P450 [Frankiaceae bacterium]|nr:cytochrome P450 [Frankiaceae bacterium]